MHKFIFLIIDNYYTISHAIRFLIKASSFQFNDFRFVSSNIFQINSATFNIGAYTIRMYLYFVCYNQLQYVQICDPLSMIFVHFLFGFWNLRISFKKCVSQFTNDKTSVGCMLFLFLFYLINFLCDFDG